MRNASPQGDRIDFAKDGAEQSWGRRVFDAKESGYFGEEVKDFETFKGDNPLRSELVSINGSFKAGRDGAKPGIIALASPKVGDAYLEEFSLGNAEDVTEIQSTTHALISWHESDWFSRRARAGPPCP